MLHRCAVQHLTLSQRLCLFQLLHEEVLSHSTLLETITAKSASISENFVTQLELQDLQERYNGIKENALVMYHVSNCKSIF